jgi:DNA-binding NtrC family response regulator
MSGEARECVLVIEGNAVDARLISKALTNSMPNALSIECVTRLNSAVERIRQGGVRALILDIELPHSQGVATFEGLLCAAPHIPILILSGMENESVARQAVEREAQDYILKSQLQTFRLRRTVHRMIERNAGEEKTFFQQQCAELTLSCTGDAVLIGDSAGRMTHLNANGGPRSGGALVSSAPAFASVCPAW